MTEQPYGVENGVTVPLILLANWVVAEWRTCPIERLVRRSAMSLQPQPINPVPADTARIARAAFPKGNVLMKMRDELVLCYSCSEG